MSDNTVYLVTGANRGIGFALVTVLLVRPNTTVFATARTASSAAPLTNFQGTVHATSKLIPVLLNEDDSSGATTSATLATRLREEHSVQKLDVIVANAGGSQPPGTVLDSDPVAVMKDFEVNAIGPLKLFQALWPLLDAGREKKFVYITSTLGSIELLQLEQLPGVGYGMSKAAANWFAKKVSVELGDKVIVGILHPGWVRTELGQVLADLVGLEQPPMTVEKSAQSVLEQIDNLTKEKSGQFLSYSGQVIPW
ncbi:hypothetical protein B0J18DRAFT_417385 [Chaetomium sp. MPI-SDFR-AT-0129]|nr:hypothetical protein B0J18DRAFT_417385 [Chaetomium sp. MPI-SDFR-AT-0129]